MERSLRGEEGLAVVEALRALRPGLPCVLTAGAPGVPATAVMKATSVMIERNES